MASKVNVPMNFGKHLRDSPTHNTLKINTSKGGEVFASSVILSFNSPVIDHMTTTLHMTSVDMLEFSEAAVQVFVDAAYSGTVEGLTKEVFRDVNKIANVFEMSWLVDKCVDYFKLLADAVKQPLYDDLLFLLEEAGYASHHLNDQHLLTLTIQKIESLKYKQEFLRQYLENAEMILSLEDLDVVIKLAGPDVHIVVQAIVYELTKYFEMDMPFLPESFQYLLENSNLCLCRQTDKDLFEKLFDMLSSLPDQYLRWTFELHRRFKTEDVTKSDKSLMSPIKESPQSSSIRDSSRESQDTKVVANAQLTLRHLGHKPYFKALKTLEDVVRWISTSEEVTSLLMAVEAIATWRQHHINKIPKLRPTVLAKLYTRLKDMAEERGWSLLPEQLRDYQFCFGVEACRQVDRVLSRYPKIVDSFYLSQLCFSSKKEPSPEVIIDTVTNFTYPISFLAKADSKLVFHFEHPEVAPCKQLSECGFILETVHRGQDYSRYAINVRLCTNKDTYIKEDMHLHDDVIRVEKMQLCLYFDIKNGESDLKFLLPLSWLGWLTEWNDDKWIRNTGINYYRPSRFAVLYDSSP